MNGLNALAAYADPAYAHVPGRTPRHAAGAFDGLCATVPADPSVADAFGCDAWRAGVQFWQRGYFWEAHEVWEAVWMALEAGSDARQLVRGMIQLANAELKVQMERPHAVLRLCAIAEAELAPLAAPPSAPPSASLAAPLWQAAGLDWQQIRDRLRALVGQVKDAI